MRGCAWVMCAMLVGALPAQQATRPTQPTPRKPVPVVVVTGPLELKDRLERSIDPDPEPRLLVMKGRRSGSANAVILVDGEAWGTVAGFAAGPEKFEAALPLVGASRGANKIAFTIRPERPGIVLDELTIIPAARVRFVIRDQGSKAGVPGIAWVESVDGKPPLPQGPFGGFPREGASWISHDGNGDLFVPFGSVVAFAARSTPFRGVSRQRHVVDAREHLLVTFLLPQDQLPDGATILEGPMRPGIASEVGRASDRARGIGKRPKDYKVLPAGETFMNAFPVIDQALAHPEIKFLASNEADSRLSPPMSFVTVELPGGDLLHSNGPVILVVDPRREADSVRAFVKVRLPEGVVADRLHVLAGGRRTEHVLKGPTTVPIDLVVAAKTPIALVVTGPPLREDAPLERAAAFRIIRAP